MHARLLAAFMSCALLLAPAIGSDRTEPVVYFFWSASCPYSKAARTFLLAAQSKDRALRIRDLEVDESLANLRLLGSLYDRIGLPEALVVPTIVIGHRVIVGYIGDDTTGQEILSTVAACRKAGCKDAVRDLIEEQSQGRFKQVLASSRAPRVACARQPGRAVH